MTTPNEHERMVEEARKRYIEMWDRGEFQWNHHKGDSRRKPINPERIWQIFIAPTLTTLLAEREAEVRREVGAELIQLAKGHEDPYLHSGCDDGLCQCSAPDFNNALDVMKQHITDVTGVK